MKSQLTFEEKLSIHERQNWRCCYCGIRLCSVEPYEDYLYYCNHNGINYKSRIGRNKFRARRASVEHLVRLVDGGDDNPDNVVSACHYCNNNRQEHSPENWYNIIQQMIEQKTHYNY